MEKNETEKKLIFDKINREVKNIRMPVWWHTPKDIPAHATGFVVFVKVGLNKCLQNA